MIYRGTTPTHIFSFPFDENQISAVYITYMQKGEVKVEKDISQITFNSTEQTIEVKLTQEDTLSFDKYGPYDTAKDSMCLIQVRALTTDNEAWTSEPVRERIGDVLKDGIIPTVNE